MRSTAPDSTWGVRYADGHTRTRSPPRSVCRRRSLLGLLRGPVLVLPTIGTLFLLNFVSATVVGVALLVPLEQIFRRSGRTIVAIAALSGFGIAATSLVALLVSEHAPLFGFMESNYRPAIIIAIASEAAAAMSLVSLLFGFTIKALKTSVARPSRSAAAPPKTEAITKVC